MKSRERLINEITILEEFARYEDLKFLRSVKCILEVLLDIRDEIKKYNDTPPNLR